MNYKKAFLLAFDIIIVLFILRTLALDFGYGKPYHPEDIARFAALGFVISGYCLIHIMFKDDEPTTPS